MVNLERALRTRTGPKHGLVGEPAASGRQSKAQYHLNAHGRRTHPKQGWGRRSNLVEAQGRRAHPKQGWDRGLQVRHAQGVTRGTKSPASRSR